MESVVAVDKLMNCWDVDEVGDAKQFSVQEGKQEVSGGKWAVAGYD